MFESKPWLKYYGDVPHTLEYPDCTMVEAVLETARENPNVIAYDFMGYTASYKTFADQIIQLSNALYDLGIREGDRITISMPTCPQGVICFYAVNKLGAIASMIHPLSPAKEVEYYIKVSQSKFALTADMFYESFTGVINAPDFQKLIITKMNEYLPINKSILFYLAKGRKIEPVPKNDKIVDWKGLMKKKFPQAPKPSMKADDLAVIMYSGGTTGKPKGIMLSNRNFITEGKMVIAWGGDLTNEDSILAILPIFHGFGLGVCVNAALSAGGKSILVPLFEPKLVAKLIKKKRPSFVVGVPTLFEALTNDPVFQKTDLSCLKGTFSGADTLPRTVKERFESIVKNNNGDIQLLEGYGLTEAVTAIMAMPKVEYREGSVGVPFPDMLAKIVKTGTQDEAPLGEDGEICLSGPAVMLGYLDEPEETAKTLQKHKDGRIWLHTGDIASMDQDGFFYFKQRLKRMIKSSGMNVYPSQVEDVLYRHPDVDQACVIGVPDKKQIEKVKAFVVLKNKSLASTEKADELIKHCQEHLIKWSCPREIEFREDLPKTRVGKIAYKELEDSELAKHQPIG